MNEQLNKTIPYGARVSWQESDWLGTGEPLTITGNFAGYRTRTDVTAEGMMVASYYLIDHTDLMSDLDNIYDDVESIVYSVDVTNDTLEIIE